MLEYEACFNFVLSAQREDAIGDRTLD